MFSLRSSFSSMLDAALWQAGEREATQGNPSKGQTGADPRNGGHSPKERLLQVPYAVFFFKHRPASRVVGVTQWKRGILPKPVGGRSFVVLFYLMTGGDE